MKITELEYNVLMQAINNAKAAIEDDEFIDPYSEHAKDHTEEELLEALNSIESKFIADKFDTNKYFTVLRIHRDDFASQGFDGDSLTDEQMEDIADKMGEGFCESGDYWSSIDYLAKHYELPKLPEPTFE